MFTIIIGLIFLAMFAVFIFLIIRENDISADREQAKKELQCKLDRLTEKQQQTANTISRIERQIEPHEVVETVIANEPPQKKVEPQHARNDSPQKSTPKPQTKAEPVPKQQLTPKPKPKPKHEPVKVTEVQESMFPTIPLEKGDEVTAILDSDGIYYIDNRKASGIIWIPYTPDSQASIDVIKDIFDVRFETRGAVITKGYPAWRVMIR